MKCYHSAMPRCETLCLFLTSSYVYFSIMQKRGVCGGINKSHKPAPSSHSRSDLCTNCLWSRPLSGLPAVQWLWSYVFLSVNVKAPPQLNTGTIYISKCNTQKPKQQPHQWGGPEHSRFGSQFSAILEQLYERYFWVRRWLASSAALSTTVFTTAI